ncbi:putative helicase with zinc finger domain [Nymphon striatum]|nr:putative helicase with zinc finger domain [Nymphon striatum]
MNSVCSNSANNEVVVESASGKDDLLVNGGKHINDATDIEYSVCKENFSDQGSHIARTSTSEHQINIMFDEDKPWECRAPPRGISSDHYSMCESILRKEACHFGNQCTFAHSEEELEEWKERFQYRQDKVMRAKKFLNSEETIAYREFLLKKYFSGADQQLKDKENVPGVNLVISPNDLDLTVSLDNSVAKWNFKFSSDKKCLYRVVLLHDAHRSHFNLLSVKCGANSWDFKSQEWINEDANLSKSCHDSVEIQVGFDADIFGRFYQIIVFVCDDGSVLIKTLSVCVVAPSDIDGIKQVKETVLNFGERWDAQNYNIIRFIKFLTPPEDQMLLDVYQLHRAEKFLLSQAVLEEKMTIQNYSNRFHELLYIEEMAQNAKLSRFNISTSLFLTNTYNLVDSPMAKSRYAINGELFAEMKLDLELSGDTESGRLVLTNCNSVLLMKQPTLAGNSEKPNLYEAQIEDKGRDKIFLCLSVQCVKDLDLKHEEEYDFLVQFQLNRLPFCEMHAAVDQISPKLSFLLPDVSISPTIPWSPDRQWNKYLDNRLNPKQKEAILAVTCDKTVHLPPIILSGPFGTGKTFTLAHAIKQIISLPDTRILVCTHSNSAADLYIKDYLHELCQNKPEAKPLRIFYVNRRVETVDATVLQYSTRQSYKNSPCSYFVMPSEQEIWNHRIIVSTLTTSRVLMQYQLPEGFFTHILIDEAAQALECEAIIPLSLANASTKIILAGDHMQLSPEVHSAFCMNKKFSVSLLERLYNHYPSSFSCTILLCENYRSHDAIMQFTSEIFYENKLVSSGKQPPHGLFYPLTFFTARGQDLQDSNSTSFYNESEVFEMVRRVCQLMENWPESWGQKDNSKVGIVSPYYDQVYKIRLELRKRNMKGVNVERVLNVQGKQFRALFISTVRTRYTCSTNKNKTVREEDENYGFLSDPRLLNTAITRAQSLIAVVGDPIDLCSIGKCRKIWEKFIKLCYVKSSLYGIEWKSLCSNLDGFEMKKPFYTLNPYAPEFIPRRCTIEEPYLLFPTPYFNPSVKYQPPIPMVANNSLNYSSVPYYYHPSTVPYPFPNFVPPIPGLPDHVLSTPPNYYRPPWIPIRNNYAAQPGFLPLRMQGLPLIAPSYSPSNTVRWSNFRPVQSPPIMNKSFESSFPPLGSQSTSGKSVKRTVKVKKNINQTPIKKTVDGPISTNCKLDFYIPVLQGLIPPNCSLKLLLKSPDVQDRWIKHIFRLKGVVESEEFKKCLEDVKRLEDEGHSLPPYIGKTFCKICISNSLIHDKKISLDKADISDIVEKSYRNALLNGAKSNSCDSNDRGESSRDSFILKKVNKTEESNECSESNNVKQNENGSLIIMTRSENSVNLIDQQESCPVDVVSQMINDNLDLKGNRNTNSAKFMAHNNNSLQSVNMDNMDSKNNLSCGRRSSWTPTLSVQSHNHATKRYSSYKLPNSLDCSQEKSSLDDQRKWLDPKLVEQKFSDTIQHDTKTVANGSSNDISVEFQQSINGNSSYSSNSSYDLNGLQESKLPSHQKGDDGINSSLDGSSTFSTSSLTCNKEHLLGKPLSYASVVMSNVQKYKDVSQTPNFLSVVGKDSSKDSTGLYRHFLS